MSDQEFELLAVAREAARAAADELRPRFGLRMREIRTKSGPTDLVSEADLAAEAAIRRVLAERRPADAILGKREAPVVTASCAGSSIRSTGRPTSCSACRSSP